MLMQAKLLTWGKLGTYISIRAILVSLIGTIWKLGWVKDVVVARGGDIF